MNSVTRTSSVHCLAYQLLVPGAFRMWKKSLIWLIVVLGLESSPGSFSLRDRPDLRPRKSQTLPPRHSVHLLTRYERALLPGLLQQQNMLQQGSVPMRACVALQCHSQQAARDGGCAHELAGQCAALPQGLKGLPLSLLLCGQLRGGLVKLEGDDR